MVDPHQIDKLLLLIWETDGVVSIPLFVHPYPTQTIQETITRHHKFTNMTVRGDLRLISWIRQRTTQDIRRPFLIGTKEPRATILAWPLTQTSSWRTWRIPIFREEEARCCLSLRKCRNFKIRSQPSTQQLVTLKPQLQMSGVDQKLNLPLLFLNLLKETRLSHHRRASMIIGPRPIQNHVNSTGILYQIQLASCWSKILLKQYRWRMFTGGTQFIWQRAYPKNTLMLTGGSSRLRTIISQKLKHKPLYPLMWHHSRKMSCKKMQKLIKIKKITRSYNKSWKKTNLYGIETLN